MLGVHSLALISRTFLSLYVSYLDGVIVKAIVDRDGRAFLHQVYILQLLAIFSSLALKWLSLLLE